MASTFQISSTKNLISLYRHTRKLKEYTESELNYLGKKMIVWCKFLGITNVPDPDLQKMLIAFIKKNYSDLSIEEIEAAIEMGLKNELDINMEPYNSFDAVYISAILNAYKLKRDKIRSKANRAEDKEERDKQYDAPSKTDTEQHWEDIVNWCKEKKKFPFGADWSGLFKMLEENGAIKMTDDEKKEVSKGILSERIDKINKGSLEGFPRGNLKKDDQHRRDCCERVVKDYLTKKYIQ